jgi:hypothetical protein
VGNKNNEVFATIILFSLHREYFTALKKMYDALLLICNRSILARKDNQLLLMHRPTISHAPTCGWSVLKFDIWIVKKKFYISMAICMNGVSLF